ncbi:hypothetical protein CROQUDRAFT_651379 [Cronartium quercuum f. sp. fusiforme G11]|uniref:Inositol polyphosphate-related phosphatase domain-containing protein n=1 Tax=Cronartium quercuum f. sp. fusiforme G11 TaxID=708437 RepID=A0A9P6NVJ2_9BASI|nr:hypothetical protein CROQUDRAFT_651379 [Cronartium quercuum f. sp. fusiforme G11]
MDWLLKTVQPSPTLPNSNAPTDLYPTVLEAISPHEHLKLATYVTAPGPSPAILAIVTNVDADHEQACILLLSPSPPATLLAAVPVLTSFDVSLAERAPAEQKATEPNTGNILHCRLSVSGDQLVEVEVSTADGRQALRDTILELRRLAAVANTAGLTSVDQFGDWIERYLGTRNGAKTGTKAISALAKLLVEPARPPPPSAATKELDWPEWRRNWLRERLREREGEYVSRRTIRVRIGTWNVYGKMPAESLGKWLVTDDGPSDLYVICLQEIDDSSEVYIRHRPEREQRWSEVVERSLASVGPVIKLASQQLVGLLILIFAPTHSSGNVSEIQTTYLGTGTLGMGNKGVTAVKLRYWDTHLTFINSHLAAFQAEVETRNRDYADICRRLTFRRQTIIPQSRAPKMSIPSLKFVPGKNASSPSPHSEIFRTGHLFWAGDLNYRTDLSYSAAKALASTGQLERLLAADQLRYQMESGKVFEGFEEGVIKFRPTYKFDVGTSDYDTSEKQRIPSFTDRILYLPGRTNDVEVISYNSDEIPKMSDHKPVGATFSVGVYVIDDKALAAVEGEMARELDGLENERMADVGIEPEGVIEFELSKIGATVLVKNRRKFDVGWKFVPKLGDMEVCKDWLKISQVSGVLRPDETHSVHLALDVRAIEDYVESVRRQRRVPGGLCLEAEANESGTDISQENETIELEDVIVLSVEGGRDIFIPINVKT